MIPCYLKQIERVLEIHGEFSWKTKSAAVSILGSLLCIPDHYENFELSTIGTLEKLTMIQVKQAVSKNILQVLNNYPSTEVSTSHRLICKSICCAAVTVYQEASRTNCNKELLNLLVEAILKKTVDPEPSIHSLALSCISSFAYLLSVFNQLDLSILETIVLQFNNNYLVC